MGVHCQSSEEVNDAAAFVGVHRIVGMMETGCSRGALPASSVCAHPTSLDTGAASGRYGHLVARTHRGRLGAESHTGMRSGRTVSHRTASRSKNSSRRFFYPDGSLDRPGMDIETELLPY